MNLKILILFLFFVLNSAVSYAAPQVWKSNLKKENDTFFFLYEENEKYIVNKIEVPKDRLQKILETHIFSTYKKAQKFIATKKNISSVNASDLHFSNIQTEIPGSVWPTINEWTWEWEQKYGEWIKENFDKDFFVKYNIKTDCADVAIALRWIFARIHFLPAAQITVLSNRIFSNESIRKEWENLPTSENWFEDQKFLTALDFILDNTYTHSLYLDSYPIWIDRSSLMLGTHFLKLREKGGHTLEVAEFVKDKKIYTLSSDVPKIVRRMDRYGFWLTQQPKYAPQAIQGGGGFLRMRWPVRTAEGFDLVPREEMPFYSLEQYAEDFITNNRQDFAEEVHKRFGNASTTPIERYNMAVTGLFTAFEARVNIVKNGFKFCSENDCSEGSNNYEDHSTPGRDQKIKETIDNIKDLTLNFGPQDPEMISDWDSQLPKVVVTVEGRELTLSELIKIWEDLLYSFNPNDSVAKRWGI